jgi:hypothetical protein
MKSRRKFTSDFQAKCSIRRHSGQSTMSELSSKYELKTHGKRIKKMKKQVFINKIGY